MIDYNNLKKGDVIVVRSTNIERVAIFDKITINENYPGGELHIFVEISNNKKPTLDDLYLNCIDCHFSYDLSKVTCRMANDVEKTNLYNILGKHFTEDYDKTWYKHFTDSSYFDIQDFLLDIFCIEVNEYDDDLLIPDFVGDIQNYIWDGCCKAMDMPNESSKIVETPKNKMVSLEKVVKYLEANFPDIENVGSWYKENFINNFLKAMEK